MTLRRSVSPLLCTLLLSGLLVAARAADKPVSDDFLNDTVRSRLAADAIVKGGAIDVEVHNGEVVLRGTVEEEKQRVRAEKVVRSIKGVKSVKDELKLAHP